MVRQYFFGLPPGQSQYLVVKQVIACAHSVILTPRSFDEGDSGNACEQGLYPPLQ